MSKVQDLMLPVMIRTVTEKEKDAVFYRPEIVGHWNRNVQREMNQRMNEMVQLLCRKQYVEQGVTTFEQMIGTYEIKTNERNVLSVTFSNYAYAAFHAHGLTLMGSLTFDVASGRVYSLAELFQPGSDHVGMLSWHVREQIVARQIPTFEPFTTIAVNQPYYIADKSIVLYFPLYAITPYYYGFPMFPISVYDLEPIVTEDGPLGRMM